MNIIHIFQKPSFTIINEYFLINHNPLIKKITFITKKLFFTHFSLTKTSGYTPRIIYDFFF